MHASRSPEIVSLRIEYMFDGFNRLESYVYTLILLLWIPLISFILDELLFETMHGILKV
jgi:hypothetical protein